MSVKEVEQARERLLARVEVARKAAAELRELEMKLAAYDAVLADLGASNGHAVRQEPTQQVVVQVPRAVDYSTLTRGEAIREILGMFPGVSPEKIVFHLRRAGRAAGQDDTHKVSNELSRMQKRGVVERRGRGRWYLAD